MYIPLLFFIFESSLLRGLKDLPLVTPKNPKDIKNLKNLFSS